MDLEGIMLSDISQIHKKQTLYNLFYGDSKQNKENTNNELIETENRLVVARGVGTVGFGKKG